VIRVLFVCLGNICRSPLAEGVFTDLVEKAGLDDRVSADSAGTGGWHAGEPPDPRSTQVARKHGVDISKQRARRVDERDCDRFDYVVAMDASNLDHLRRMRQGKARVFRLLDDVPELRVRDVPDPYYGGEDGFEHVYQLVTRGCALLLDRIRRDHAL
jgi:protein-tyrosine phosphatase